MFYSKKMRELLSEKESAQSALQAVMSKEGAAAKEIEDATTALSTVNSRIAAQTALESGKQFDENGQEVTGNPKPQAKKSDKFASLEYRQAFMDYCKAGVSSNVLEFRSADTATGTADVAAIIPSTILQEVIQKVESYGQVYARTRKLAIKGGIGVPISSIKPVATWIGETTVSDKQKMDLSQKVAFNYYGLECRVATSILADTVTLDQFESIITSAIAEAYMKAFDIAVVKGAGTASPLGITVDTRIPATHVVTLTAAEFLDWGAWKKKVFAKMPLSYKGGATFLMASGTFDGYIDGMTDKNGQPIGRVNYGIAGGTQESFGGKEVIEVEDDVISNYDDAAAGDVVAIYGNLGNYAINSNMSMTMYHYIDHDKNEVVNKGLLIADGKVLDPNGFIIVKKGAAA